LTDDHHDPELCRRLVMKLHDGIDIHFIEGTEYPDYCCDPVASWMLEQRMVELGWEYRNHRKESGFVKPNYPSSWMRGANRLHATALAADAIEVKS